jgi:hypothetical protein
VLKCSSLSFSVTSSLNFYALIHWILLFWLCVSPGGHQQGAGAILSVIVLEAPFCTDPGETGWSGLSATGNWPLPQSLSLSLHLGPCSASLQPPLNLSPCSASLHHRPKSLSLALSNLYCSLIHQQKIQLQTPTAGATDQRLLLPLEKLDGLVWHFSLSGFPVFERSCPIGG